MTVLKLYMWIIGIMSVLGFVLMGIDKQLAKGGMRRISEKTLLGTGALGGAAGAWLAMALFHHKTRHKVFSLGLPVLTVLHVAMFIVLVFLTSQGGLE